MHRFLFLPLVFISLEIFAGEGHGYLGIEGRYFFNKPLYPKQSEHSASASFWYEYFHDLDEGKKRVAFSGFARADSADEERSHADIRELYWWQRLGDIEIYAGIRKVFWGVTESTHLVDIINQDDLLENPDGEDKLGQPMLQFVHQQDWGLLEFFLLPGFRERQFPGSHGRLRASFAIAEKAVYQSSQAARHTDVAFRWSHYFSIWDIGISHFSGTSRDPVFLPLPDGQNGFVLTPYYPQINQSAIALQATVDAWLFKAEIAAISERDFSTHSAAVLGFEYTLFGVGGSNGDLGLISEYQFDDRSGARQQVAQNDIALGFRWAFNDLDGSEVLGIMSEDLDSGNRFLSLELSRRITDHWKVEAEARFFSNIGAGTLEFDLREDDYFQFELRRYF